MKKLIPFLALTFVCGCTVVSANRVFPKLTWYWTKDANRQRQSDRTHKAMEQEYQRTNSNHL